MHFGTVTGFKGRQLVHESHNLQQKRMAAGALEATRQEARSFHLKLKDLAIRLAAADQRKKIWKLLGE